MFKYLKLAALALCVSVGLTACDDEENSAPLNPPTEVKGLVSPMFVVTQGNQFAGIAGGIDYIPGMNDSLTVNLDYFNTVNQQSLGDTPEHAVKYDSRIYVPMNGSNLLWVLDAQTLKVIKKVQTSSTVGAWDVCGSNGYVYLINYGPEGYVTRMDTTNYELQGSVHVGAYPYDMVAANGKIYVAMSGDFEQNYADGKKVVIIDEATFQHNGEIAVGLNPSQIMANKIGELFVMCQGDYATVQPKVQKVSRTGEVTDFCTGGICAMDGNDLYVLHFTSDYQNDVATIDSLERIHTIDKSAVNVPLENAQKVGLPSALNINPANGHIVIGSSASPLAFSERGFISEFKKDGKAVARMQVGVLPFDVVFK